jgi:cell division protein FtsB
MPYKYTLTAVLVISTLVSAYFIKSTLDVYKNRYRLDEASTNLEQLQKTNEEYKKEIEYRKTDDFIVNEAREKLNYSFEGEEIVVVPDKLLEKKQEQVVNENTASTVDYGVQSEDSKKIYMQWVQALF